MNTLNTLPSPVNYFAFDEITTLPSGGQGVMDQVGDLMMSTGSYELAPGKWGPALRCNPAHGGQNVAITRKDGSPAPELVSPWTAAVWVKREEARPSSALLSSAKFAIKAEQYDWQNPHQVVGITQFGVADWSFSQGLPTGGWAHLTMVGHANPAKTSFYLDGQLVGELGESIALPRSWLGSREGNSEFFNGCLDELKLFDQALTPAQVQALAGTAPVRNPKLAILDASGAAVATGASSDLGTHDWGQTRSVTYTIKNTGKGDLDYSTALTDSTGQFAIASGSSGKVPPGGSATLQLTFTSKQENQAWAGLSIKSNDPDAATINLNLSATGKAAPPPKLEVRDGYGRILLTNHERYERGYLHYNMTAGGPCTDPNYVTFSGGQPGQDYEQRFTIYNRGSTPFTMRMQPETGPSDPLEVFVDKMSMPCEWSMPIPPGGSLSFTLRWFCRRSGFSVFHLYFFGSWLGSFESPGGYQLATQTG